MVNWMQAWMQIHHSWSFLHHAYRCGWSLCTDASDAWVQRGYALAYVLAQFAPNPSLDGMAA